MINNDLTQLSGSISDAWDDSTVYAVGDYCIYNNVLWKCKVQNSNVQPTEGTYWTAVSVGEEIASVNSRLSNKTPIVVNAASLSNVSTNEWAKADMDSIVVPESGWYQINIPFFRNQGGGGSNYFHVSLAIASSDTYSGEPMVTGINSNWSITSLGSITRNLTKNTNYNVFLQHDASQAHKMDIRMQIYKI